MQGAAIADHRGPYKERQHEDDKSGKSCAQLQELALRRQARVGLPVQPPRIDTHILRELLVQQEVQGARQVRSNQECPKSKGETPDDNGDALFIHTGVLGVVRLGMVRLSAVQLRMVQRRVAKAGQKLGNRVVMNFGNEALFAQRLPVAAKGDLRHNVNDNIDR